MEPARRRIPHGQVPARQAEARRSDPTNQFLQFDEEKGFDIVDELSKPPRAYPYWMLEGTSRDR